jgi:CheY-like chemotaxis protein
MSETTLKVLVVDDETLIRMAVRDIFEDAGAYVVEAGNGVEALRLLNAYPDFDLLFTDVMMPRMGGIELAKEARRLIPSLEVVFTTGYSDKDIPGAFPVIRKPWNMADLERLILESASQLRARQRTRAE